MGSRRSIRSALAAALVSVSALTSGCVVFQGGLDAGPQSQIIGDFPVKLVVCASGSPGCPDGGYSQLPALDGTGQVLLGIRLQTSVSVPSSFTSTGPEALAFTRSPSYAAELQRLAPAAPGTRWIGFISAVTNYAFESGPQSFPVRLPYTLGRGADGSPFKGPVEGELRLGGRQVTAAFPGSRPVVCGPSLTAVFDEDASAANELYVICTDTFATHLDPVRDLGILSGAAASGSPGGLAAMAFELRFAGSASPLANFALTATTTLPGAAVAVTPDALIPAANGASQARAAIGIPPGARAGTYDVTLTARLANGQTRTGVGRLTVLGGATAGGGAGTLGRLPARLRLTTVLPRGLSAAQARARGIVVLIGASTARESAGPAVPGSRQEAKGEEERAPAGPRARPSRAEEQEAGEGSLPDRHHGRRTELRAAGGIDEVARSRPSCGSARPRAVIESADGVRLRRDAMAVAVILDFPGATLEQYDQVVELMGFTKGGPGAPGGLFHWVTKTDDGIRVVDVWESRETFERFAQEKIGPLTQQVGVTDPPRTRFCEVYSYLTAA